MSKTEKVTCDECEKDITYTTNFMDYRLTLKAENKPVYPTLTAMTAMHITPDIDETLYFCGINCLKKYINEKYEEVG